MTQPLPTLGCAAFVLQGCLSRLQLQDKSSSGASALAALGSVFLAAGPDQPRLQGEKRDTPNPTMVSPACRQVSMADIFSCPPLSSTLPQMSPVLPFGSPLWLVPDQQPPASNVLPMQDSSLLWSVSQLPINPSYQAPNGLLSPLPLPFQETLGRSNVGVYGGTPVVLLSSLSPQISMSGGFGIGPQSTPTMASPQRIQSSRVVALIHRAPMGQV